MPEVKNICFNTLPKRKEVIRFVFEVRNYLFPRYFERTILCDKKYREKKLRLIKRLYKRYICKTTLDGFLKQLPSIESQLQADIDFFMESDPSIDYREEIIISFPGFLAITFYRIAHAISNLDVCYVPRIISEEAHSMTGIDIHPRAKIGSPFFIDHGTGIVIGETSKIGKRAKIYQCVTLGAVSLSNAKELRGVTRHPQVGDDVTIYAGASLLGPIKIGNNTTIG